METTAPPRLAEALPPGTRLGDFELLQVLGAGGFGIVYRALDGALQREVAIKEYLPRELAARGPGESVVLRSGCEPAFEAGRRWFVNEARLLARFDHPALVKVLQYWEGNGTAYMAMPLYRGRPLHAVVEAAGAAPAFDELALRGALLEPLLGAVELLHAENVCHRDIAPDNILLGDDGRPVLLDLGAARHVLPDTAAPPPTSIVKPSFAPIEQYADSRTLRQGPWTDLYALAAVLRFVLTGEVPPASATRAVHDELVPLARRGVPGMSAELLSAIDWALAVRPQERPQSVAAWRDALAGDALPRPAAPGEVTLPQVAPYAPPVARWPTTPRERRAPPPRPEAPASVVDAGAPAFPLVACVPAATPAPPRRKMALAVPAAVLLLASVVAVGMAPLRERPADEPAEVPAALDVPGPPAALDVPAPRPIVEQPAKVRSARSGKPAPPARAPARDALAAAAPATGANRSAAAGGGPRDACRGQYFIALAHCIERECAGLREHPECLRISDDIERRRALQP